MQGTIDRYTPISLFCIIDHRVYHRSNRHSIMVYRYADIEIPLLAIEVRDPDQSKKDIRSRTLTRMARRMKATIHKMIQTTGIRSKDAFCMGLLIDGKAGKANMLPVPLITFTRFGVYDFCNGFEKQFSISSISGGDILYSRKSL